MGQQEISPCQHSAPARAHSKKPKQPVLHSFGNKFPESISPSLDACSCRSRSAHQSHAFQISQHVIQFLIRLRKCSPKPPNGAVCDVELKIKQQKDSVVVVKKRSGTTWEAEMTMECQALATRLVQGRQGLCILKLVLLITASGGRCHFPHFRGGESKAQRGEVLCPRSHSQ